LDQEGYKGVKGLGGLMVVRRKLIREMVEALLERHGVEDGAVPVDDIARNLGIEVTRDRVDDELSGFIVRDQESNKVVIGANKSHHPHRQRFTVAHELGHFLLHKGQPVHLDEDNTRAAFRVNLRSAESTTGEDNDEREANLFAAELLMPASFLKKDLQGKDVDLLDDGKFLEKLAGKYKVSVQALTFRLAYLRYITL
jgi:Zn-dependent peptidase ImmA (M78 family)